MLKVKLAPLPIVSWTVSEVTSNEYKSANSDRNLVALKSAKIRRRELAIPIPKALSASAAELHILRISFDANVISISPKKP